MSPVGEENDNINENSDTGSEDTEMSTGENLTHKKQRLICNVLKEMEEDVDEKKAQNIVIYTGYTGVDIITGKSSSIGTVAAYLSDRGWRKHDFLGYLGYCGFHGSSDSCQVTYNTKSYPKDKYLEEGIYNEYSTLIDIPGFENEETECIKELLRILLCNRIPREEAFNDALDYYKDHGLEGLKAKYSTNEEGMKVHHIAFVASGLICRYLDRFHLKAFETFPKEHTENDKKEEQDDLRLVLIGKTGAGKSSTGNSLLGTKAFESRLSLQRVTKQMNAVVVNKFGRKIKVIDTPGIDTLIYKHQQNEFETELEQIANGRIDIYAVVISLLENFTREDIEVIKTLRATFKEDFDSRCILLFTGFDDFEDRGLTFEDFKASAPRELRQILDQYPSMAINNCAEDHLENHLLLGLIKFFEKRHHSATISRNCTSYELVESSSITTTFATRLRVINERKLEILNQQERFNFTKEIPSTYVAASVADRSILGFVIWGSMIIGFPGNSECHSNTDFILILL